MDIRNSLDSLKSLLGVPSAASSPVPIKVTPPGVGSGMTSDRATFSSAGSEVSLTAADSGVRADKVAAVQQALASGTYNIAPSAVASRMVDSMLGAAS